MIITIRKVDGLGSAPELLGMVDATHLASGTRHDLSLQLENLADLTSSHEPSASEGPRFEVEVLGPGPLSNYLVVEGSDPEHPATQALRVLMGTLGLGTPVPEPVR